MKFKLNTKDTLRRVQFYFNPTLSGANDQYFDIMVWKSIDPEELIYTKRVKAKFTNGLYNFYTYDLDTSIVLANEFYVGFRQINSQNLNIGFDYAIDSKEYLFYNIGTGWNFSVYSGSLMIRPVFGENMPTAIEDIVSVENTFRIYPNPLNSSYLNFQIVDGIVEDYNIEVFNITGQRLLQTDLSIRMDVSELKSGVYFIRLTNKQTLVSTTQKLIVNKR